MYLVKYILLNTVCHSHTILFIAVSIKNIVNMRAATNNSLKHVHVCHSLDVSTVRQDIASAVWRAYSQLAYAARNPATAIAKTATFPPVLRKIFNDDPQLFCTFSVDPLLIHNSALYN